MKGGEHCGERSLKGEAFGRYDTVNSVVFSEAEVMNHE